MIKSRIPHKRTVKGSGLPVFTKLPQPKSKTKSASSLKIPTLSSPPALDIPSEPEENGNDIAFICSPSVNNNSNHLGRPDEDNLALKDVYSHFKSDFDEQCEVLSVSSAGPSPIKLLETDDSNSLTGTEDIDNLSNTSFIDNFNSSHLDNDPFIAHHLVDDEAPDLIAFRRFQEVISPKASGRSSPSSEKDEPVSKGKLPLPSSAALKSSSLLKKGKKFSRNKPPPGASKGNSNTFASPKAGTKPSKSKGFSQRDRVPLPSEKPSPALAMSYVRKITSALQPSGEGVTTRRRPRAFGEASGMQRYNGRADITENAFRKVAVPTKTTVTKNNGKWCSDIDSAINIPRRNSKHILDEQEVTTVISTRHERRRPSTVKNASETNKPEPQENLKNPRIARPVVRPVRSRLHFSGSQDSLSGDKPSVPAPKPETPTNDPANTEQDSKTYQEPHDDDLPEPKVSPSRRSSVPTHGEAQISVGRSRTRRRASEHFNKRLLSGNSDESGYSTNTASSSYNDQTIPTDRAAGDFVKQDIVRMQERLKQNERYKEILENPEIVTFGQWRVQQEGNYAPEEMYGVTERQRIRSSSGSLSPVRRTLSSDKDSFSTPAAAEIDASKNCKNEDLVFEKDALKENGSENVTGFQSDEEETNMNSNEDLPSLNSTALMADYSIQSNASSPEKQYHSQSTGPVSEKTILSASQHKAINKLLNEGLNSFMEQSSNKANSSSDNIKAEVLASPFRTRAAADDIQHVVSRVNSNGELDFELVELVEEYKIVRVVLEQIYKVLEVDETNKSRRETEIKNLTRKNAELHEQVHNLSKLLELQTGQQFQRREQNRMRRRNSSGSTTSFHHVATQTTQPQSERPTWYRSELSSVESKLENAVIQLRQISDLKDEFNQKINDAEQKLTVLMTSIKDSEG